MPAINEWDSNMSQDLDRLVLPVLDALEYKVDEGNTIGFPCSIDRREMHDDPYIKDGKFDFALWVNDLELVSHGSDIPMPNVLSINFLMPIPAELTSSIERRAERVAQVVEAIDMQCVGKTRVSLDHKTSDIIAKYVKPLMRVYPDQRALVNYKLDWMVTDSDVPADFAKIVTGGANVMVMTILPALEMAATSDAPIEEIIKYHMVVINTAIAREIDDLLGD